MNSVIIYRQWLVLRSLLEIVSPKFGKYCPMPKVIFPKLGTSVLWSHYCNLVYVTWSNFDQWHAHISTWGIRADMQKIQPRRRDNQRADRVRPCPLPSWLKGLWVWGSIVSWEHRKLPTGMRGIASFAHGLFVFVLYETHSRTQKCVK